MTKELADRYFSYFEMDPILFADPGSFRPYIHSREQSDARVDRYEALGRVYLAVMLDEEPIGEVVLKNIDHHRKHCTLGICLVSDRYKNKGYGTAAEILAFNYAFGRMGLETVYADSIHRNKRSQHVLEKVGFRKIGRDDTFVYYPCQKESWNDDPDWDTIIIA